MSYTRREVLERAGVAGGVVAGLGGTSAITAASIGCPRTPGYWKNHVEEWPDSVDGTGDEYWRIGEVSLSKAEVLALLERPPRGDKAVILAKQYVARVLNLYRMDPDNECAEQYRRARDALQADGIDPSKSAAEAWFDAAAWPEEPQRSWVVDGRDGEVIKDFYESFNEGELCDGCGSGGDGNGDDEGSGDGNGGDGRSGDGNGDRGTGKGNDDNGTGGNDNGDDGNGTGDGGPGKGNGNGGSHGGNGKGKKQGRGNGG